MEVLWKKIGHLWFFRLLTSPRLQAYYQNLSWLVFEKLMAMGVALVVSIYVARYLKPENFGLLNYAISFVGIFSAFSTLGLDQILVRELSKDESRKNDLLGTSFVLKLLGATLLLCLMSIILLFMQQDVVTNYLIFVIAIAELLRAFEVISSFYQSKVKSKYIVPVQVSMNLTVSAIKLSLVYFEMPLTWFAWVVFVNYMLNAIGFVFVFRRKTGSLSEWRFNKALAVSLLKESWPLVVYGLAILTHARIDQVMLGNLLNNYEVGQYSVALKIIEIFGFVPMVLMSTFTPAIAKAKAAGEDVYFSRLANLYRIMFISFLLVAIPIALFGKSIVLLCFGSEYEAAGFLLSLFAIRIFFTHMGVGKSSFIVNESLFGYALITAIVGAIANIAVNFWLIPIWGTVGSFIATVISYTISIFLIDIFFVRTRKNLVLMIKSVFSFWNLRDQ